MTPLILIAADLAAISILTFALYLRRHRRRDLVVSYLGMNVGVMAVAAALSGSAAEASAWASASSESCPSSGCVPPNWHSMRWPTTSRPWPLASSPASGSTPCGCLWR